MKRTFILQLLLLTFLPTGFLSAQQVYLLLQGGQSSYGAVYVGNLGGGGGDQDWKPGPIIGVGVRLKTSLSFSVDGTVEYSTHPYGGGTSSYPIKGDPRNRIVEANAVGRAIFTIVEPLSGSFSFGAGYWYQEKDPIEYNSPIWATAPGHTDSGMGALVGLGLGVQLAARLDLYLDGNLRARKYLTPVLQLGLAYRVG